MSPLRLYRQTHKLSPTELAKRCGKDKTTWFRWERTRVPAEDIAQIEIVTGIPRHVLRPDLFAPAVPKDGVAA